MVQADQTAKAFEELSKRVEELTLQVQNLEIRLDRISFIEAGEQLIFLLDGEPLFSIKRATKEDITFHIAATEKETKEAFTEAMELLQEDRGSGLTDQPNSFEG